jgi:hypothetical protein
MDQSSLSILLHLIKQHEKQSLRIAARKVESFLIKADEEDEEDD